MSKKLNHAARGLLAVLTLALLACESTPAPEADAGARPDGTAGSCASDRACDDGVFCNGAELCDPGSASADARGCVASSAAVCPSGRSCSEELSRCVTICEMSDDADGDGVSPPECGGFDCDDSDPNRYPGNVEVCDAEGHDEDCVPTTLAGEDGDRDSDGFVRAECCYLTPRGVLECGRDCDDDSFSRNPGGIEVCNGRDDDCNGLLDHPDEDDDHDDHADDRCAGSAGTDCDDRDPFTYVGAIEFCDGIDNDCMIDGARRVAGEDGTQPGEDDDGDGHSPPGSACLATGPEGSTPFPKDDCDDSNAAVHPGAVELCDGIDNDCNGVPDDAGGSAVAGSACVPISIHPGGSSTCALRADGRVVCWGANASSASATPAQFDGRLGDPAAPQDAAIVVPGVTDAVALDVGDSGACALLADATVFCWGNPLLSGEYTTTRPPPVSASGPVAGLSAVTDLSVGSARACAVSGGRVYCWGFHCMGSLDGLGGSCEGSALPREVMGIADATQVDVGGVVSCARLITGGVSCWGFPAGAASDGYFGGGASTDNPSTVVGITDAVEVAAGGTHACARLAGGGVRCWGRHTRGALGCSGASGCPAVGASSSTPVAVAGLSDALSLEAGGGAHTCARRATGQLVCWGANDWGQLGNGDLIDPGGDAANDSASPVVVSAPEPFTAFGVGAAHSCAIGARFAYCWGDGRRLQLGDGRTQHVVPSRPGFFTSSLPIAVSVLFPAIQIAGTNDHTCFRMPDGSARCAGTDSGFDEIGPVSLVGHPEPIPLGEGPFVHIATGFDTTCGVLATGGATCAGRISADLRAETAVAQVAVGDEGRFSGHACLLRRDGTAACWGSNLYSALGSAGVEDADSPLDVAGIAGGLEIVSGSAHVCVRTATEVWCWGRGSAGELGSPPTADSTSPRRVTGLPSRPVDLSAMRRGTCAALADGQVYCWGEAQGGVTPTRVAGLTEIVEVAATVGGGCARDRSGGIWCWGANESGQHGDGTNTGPMPAPAGRATYLAEATSVGCGRQHCCATRTSGQTVCWGLGTSGQLANFAITSSSVPITTVDLSRQ